MLARVTIVSFLPIGKLSIRVASKRHNAIEYRSFKNFSRDYFRSIIASEIGMV